MSEKLISELKIGNKYIKEQITSISDSLDNMNLIWHNHDVQLAKNNLAIKEIHNKIKEIQFLMDKSGFGNFIKENWWKIGGFLLTWIIIIEKVHS